MSTDWPNPLAVNANEEIQPLRLLKNGERWTVETEEAVTERKGNKTPNFIRRIAGPSVQHANATRAPKEDRDLPSEEIVDDRCVRIETKLQREAWEKAKASVESPHAAPPRDQEQRQDRRDQRSSLGIDDRVSHTGGTETAS